MFTNFKLKKKNKKNFHFKSNNNKIILIEYNSFHGSHLCQALLANFLKKKNFSKIVAYFNYCLIVSPLRLNLLQKIKWKLSSLLNFGFKGIYKSFGVEKFIRPEITKDTKDISNKIVDNFFSQKVNKFDVINFKIENFWIGDLLYDTYVKSKLKPTIDVNDRDFKFFFKEFIELFFYWKFFFETNEVSSIIGSHSCYSFGLPMRIALNHNIPTYVVNTRSIIKLDSKVSTMYGEFINLKKNFSELPSDIKKNGIELSKKKLNLRFKGVSGLDVDLYNTNISSFGKIDLKKKYLKESKKIKIIICTHDFHDAIHVNGKNFFPDFYTWVEYLGELSMQKSEKYDFYIKNHPSFENKYKKYQSFTDEIVNNFCKKYKNLSLLPNNLSHHQIIHEGINFVLTVYGSVGVEYSYFNIPVINASTNNPHINYNFTITPSNLNDYKNTLENLEKIKHEIDKNEIYEYYFMRNLFIDQNWLFDDYNNFMNTIGGYHQIHSSKFYEYWLKNFDDKKRDILFNRFENFTKSKYNRINIFHTNKQKTFNY